MSRFEAYQQKPWYFHCLISGLLAALIYAGFWYFVTSGVRQEAADLQAQVDQLLAANAKAQIAQQRLNEFKAKHTQAQAGYDDLKALLPEQRELTNVLLGIQDRARNRLVVTRFTPKDDFQQDFYSGKPIEVEVSSSYNNVGAFFAQMAAYQRIVSITDFKLSRMSDQTPGRTVDAQFVLTAYYATPEMLKPQPAAKPGAPASAAASPPPAAPAAK